MLLLALCLSMANCANTSVDDGQLAFRLPDLDGRVVSSADERFKGKVVLVDIWGAWCPPCRTQIPMLAMLQEKYRDRGLVVVGIDFEMVPADSYEEQRAILKIFAEEMGINYLVLLGGGTGDVQAVLPAIRNFSGFPTSIFIGRDGLVKKVKVGYTDGQADRYDKTIAGLLEQETPRP